MKKSAFFSFFLCNKFLNRILLSSLGMPLCILYFSSCVIGSIDLEKQIEKIEKVFGDGDISISYSNFKIQDSDGDGYVSAGEPADIYVTFKAEGARSASDLSAELFSKSEYLQVVQAESSSYAKAFQAHFIVEGTSAISSDSVVSSPVHIAVNFNEEDYTFDFYIDCKNPGQDVKPSISKEYWGTWIQMDTGDEFYIDSERIWRITSTGSRRFVQQGSAGYSFEAGNGENILSQGNVLYFRKGGSARNFTVSVSGFDSVSRTENSSRATSSMPSLTGVKVKRVNTNNSSDTQTVVPDSDGTTVFTACVAGDEQTLQIVSDVMDSSQASESTSISFTPSFSGENIGSVPLVEKGMYGFKTTYTIDCDEQGICYGNDYREYTLTLKMTNIGSASCSTSVYTVSCDDSKLNVYAHGNFTKISPGKEKSVTCKVKYGELKEDYADVPVKICIQDMYGKTWNDSVSLRFYKGFSTITVMARNFDEESGTVSSSGSTGSSSLASGSNSAALKGFLIYPDGRSKRFTVAAGSEASVQIPFSNKPYKLVFSGSYENCELAYGFALAGNSVPDIYDTYEQEDLISFEPNNTLNTAAVVNAAPVKSYLHDYDIDFYEIVNLP